MSSGAEQFHVVLFFDDDSYIYEGGWRPAEEATLLAISHTKRPTGLIGMTKRVIVVDRDDRTCFDWRFGEGVVFPTMEQIEEGRSNETPV